MNDYIIRATAANDQIRAFAAVTTEMVETAREHHNTSPVATAALGRLLTAGAMMGSMMKGEKDVLTLQIKAGGPLQGITVTADSQGNVKGYVGNPDVCIPANSKGKLDVAGAVGPGFLTVIKDMGLKEPYSGQVMLQTCEIAEDLTYYFATSEQVPSAVGLGVLMNKNNTVRQAGGFIVQLMPFAEEEVISRLEQNVQKINSVTVQIALGLSQGIMPLISYNYASGNIKRMKKTFFFTARIALVFLILMEIAYYAGANVWVGLFMQDQQIVEYGSRFLRGFCLGMPFLAMDFLAVGVFQACGLGKNAFLFAILRKWCWKFQRCLS